MDRPAEGERSCCHVSGRPAETLVEAAAEPVHRAGSSVEAEEVCQALSGVRARRPFADVDLWAFFLSLRAKRSSRRCKARMLRRLLRGRVPDEILDRTKKTLFDDAILANIDYPTLRRLLLDSAYRLEESTTRRSASGSVAKRSASSTTLGDEARRRPCLRVEHVERAHAEGRTCHPCLVAEVEQEAALRAAARSRTMLETREISHRFGDNLVLNRVSFRVGEGEIHALLGPNGAGKTTLIRILAGLLHPTVGIVNVTGFEPRANAELFRQQIGFVPSGDRTFYLRISALENLVFFARLHGMRRAAAVRRAGRYSRGRSRTCGKTSCRGSLARMQKRLSVARAPHVAARAVDRRGDSRPRSRGRAACP